MRADPDVLELFAPSSLTPAQRLERLPAGSQPVATSEEAAAGQEASALGKQRLRVLRALYRVRKNDTPGLTADEIAAMFQEPHNRVAPRLTELLGLELAERLDGRGGRPSVRRPTRMGASAYVHRITPAGIALVEDR